MIQYMAGAEKKMTKAKWNKTMISKVFTQNVNHYIPSNLLRSHLQKKKKRIEFYWGNISLTNTASRLAKLKHSCEKNKSLKTHARDFNTLIKYIQLHRTSTTGMSNPWPTDFMQPDIADNAPHPLLCTITAAALPHWPAQPLSNVQVPACYWQCLGWNQGIGHEEVLIPVTANNFTDCDILADHSPSNSRKYTAMLSFTNIRK